MVNLSNVVLMRLNIIGGSLVGHCCWFAVINSYELECAGEHEAITCELQALGFTEQDAESAINSVSHPNLAVCLDWLCLHIPEEELPLAFAPGKLLYMLFICQCKTLHPCLI